MHTWSRDLGYRIDSQQEPASSRAHFQIPKNLIIIKTNLPRAESVQRKLFPHFLRKFYS